MAILPNTSNKIYESYQTNPETAANCLICLIHQTNYLLDRQLQAVEKNFISKGGYSKQLLKKRPAYRFRNSHNRI